MFLTQPECSETRATPRHYGQRVISGGQHKCREESCVLSNDRQSLEANISQIGSEGVFGVLTAKIEVA